MDIAAEEWNIERREREKGREQSERKVRGRSERRLWMENVGVYV